VTHTDHIVLSRHTSGMGETRNAFRILVGKPHGKQLVGRQTWSSGYNFKMDLGGTRCEDGSLKEQVLGCPIAGFGVSVLTLPVLLL
jgi:hypothetical protein